MTIEPVARFRSPVGGKFGLPRQSGLSPHLRGEVVFEPAFRSPEAIRGLEGFSHIWLLWVFDRNPESASLTVRPPSLGGNESVGVFASRSPFRPNGIGLSCVELLSIENRPGEGNVLVVAGADLADGTAIVDIKPYLSYADAIPEARCGFAPAAPEAELDVAVPGEVAALFGNNDLAALKELLALDPRPAWHDDPLRVYGFPFAGYDVRFRVDGDKLTVTGAEKLQQK